MIQDYPLVSVGMPVYNGERYMKEALDSLLAQDYPSFQVLISDNASTDRTQQISLEYTARDSRVKYFRHEENLTATKNFNWIFEQSEGKYFMWAAHDDVWATGFISKCAEKLDNEKNAVLCFSIIQLIDQNGCRMPEFIENRETLNMSTHHRIRSAILNSGRLTGIYSLIRRESLLRTNLFREACGSDWRLLLELAVLGTFAKVPETLFYYRLSNEKRNIRLQETTALYYSREIKIPPYPLSGTFAATITWRELCRAIRVQKTTFRLRLEYFVSLLFFAPRWYQIICHEHKRTFFYRYQSKNRAGALEAFFYSVLFFPFYLLDYDFMCVALETIVGKRIWLLLRKIKISFKL